MKKKMLFFFFIIIPISSILSQVSNWRNYTDMKKINDIKASDNGFWGASGGGAFFYNSLTDSFKVLSKADGLNGGSLTAITIDKKGNVWFGSANGIIDIYNPNTNNITSILDIYNNSERTQKSVNVLKSIGDTIYAATDFGIALINPDNFTFYDTYFKYGNLSSYIPVNNITIANKIYACTDQGVVIQKEGAQNLSAPDSWNVYTTSNGLPSKVIYKIVTYNNSIIASTQNGLAEFNGTSWTSFLPQLTGSVTDIISNGDSLVILNGKQIYSYKNGNLTSIYTSQIDMTKLDIFKWK